jgi:hypothetical protein
LILLLAARWKKKESMGEKKESEKKGERREKVAFSSVELPHRSICQT